MLSSCAEYQCPCHEKLRELIYPVKIVRDDGAVYGFHSTYSGLGWHVEAKPILFKRDDAIVFCGFHVKALKWKLEMVIVEV